MSDERAPVIANNSPKKKPTILCVVLLIVISILAVTGTVTFVLSISTAVNVHTAASRPVTAVTATYERIGSSDCPGELVYKGFTAGFPTTTGTTLFKCLPLENHINYYSDNESRYTNQPEIRHVNATEYRTFIGGNAINNHDAVCAVCQVTGRSTIQVLPTTYNCSDDSWTEEYKGYLMTDNMATTFVCVDRSLGVIQNTGSPKLNAPVLRHVVVPYKLGDNIQNNYEPDKVLSCVVCSK